MADLTDEELAEATTAHDRLSAVNVNAWVDPEALLAVDRLQRAAIELQLHRAARAADEERVRIVVREAVCAEFTHKHDDETIICADWNEIRDAIATRVAKQLAGAVKPRREVIPFTAERQEYVNSVELRGGEVPQPGTITPEQLADHCNRMICSFWSWPGNEYSDGELVYRVALGALRRMQQLATAVVRLDEDEREDLDALLGSLQEQRDDALNRGLFATSDVFRDQHRALSKLLGREIS